MALTSDGITTREAVARAREKSISSLKELVVILTGLTITTGMVNSLHRLNMKFNAQDARREGFIHWFRYAHEMHTDGIACACRLAILILCVMRFHHGNLMLLDKSYSLSGQGDNRNIVVDFVAVFFPALRLPRWVFPY